jgi:Ca2+/Na+ antiporter
MAQMKSVAWMTAMSTLSAIAASTASGAVIEVWLGMIAPLTVVVGSLIVMARMHDKQPERLTSAMVVAFFGKLVFFGAYVGFVVGVLHVRPVPFVASFTSYFIALYAAEAVCLQRMFSERMRTA